MKKLLLVLYVLLLALPATSAVLKHGPGHDYYSFFEACRAGVKGGGYDKATELYDWTCGNYPWSAWKGGTRISAGDGSTLSDYNTPTTAGGNSWTMICTGDGVADQTGAGSTTPDATPVEETVCLSATERPVMYAMADIMLAADNVRSGGKIYLPRGLYHLAYCGQQADGTTANGCPVLQHANDHFQRMVNMWGGLELIGEGQDLDGPHVNGRTGTWFLAGGGDDLDGDGDLSEIADRNGDGWTANSSNNGNGVIKVGGNSSAYTCYRDDDTGGCAVNATVATMPTMHFARDFSSAILDQNITQDAASYSRVCLDNRVSTTGTCAETTNQITGTGLSDTRSLRCTDTVGGRLSTTTGDCVIDGTDYGPCEGLVNALLTNMTAQELTNTLNPVKHITIQSDVQEHRGLGSVLRTKGQTSIARIGAFEVDGDITGATLETCKTNGKQVYLTAAGEQSTYMHPSFMPILDISELESTTVTVVDWERLNNAEGGYSHINIMPAHWYGRNSTNTAADCPYYNFDPAGCTSAGVPQACCTGAGAGVTCNNKTQDDGTERAACDSVGLIHFGASWRGHARYISTWYGGGKGAAAYSMVDGNNLGIYTELGWSALNSGIGAAADASGWWFHDNVWRDWDAPSFMFWNFAPQFRVERDRFINIDATYGFISNESPGLLARDLEIISSDFSYGMFDLMGARQARYQGIRGIGNRGIVFLIAPRPNVDTWDVVVEDFIFNGHTLINGGARPEGLIVRYDGDGNATWKGGNIDNVTFRDGHFTLAEGTDACMIFLEGGSGDEVTVTNNDDEEHGDGRTVDDDRHQLSFEGISIERVSVDDVSGQTEFFCLGNGVAAEQDPAEAMALVANGIFGSKGGMPRWTNLCIDGMCYPDNPYRSVRAVDAVLNSTSDVDSNQITFTDHGLRDRDVVTLDVVSGYPPTNLVDDTRYYVIYVDKDAISLDDDRSVAAALTISDEIGTFTLTTGFEPDCSTLPQGTSVRSHSSTAEGVCLDNDADGLLDGGGDYNALCLCGSDGLWRAAEADRQSAMFRFYNFTEATDDGECAVAGADVMSPQACDTAPWAAGFFQKYSGSAYFTKAECLIWARSVPGAAQVLSFNLYYNDAGGGSATAGSVSSDTLDMEGISNGDTITINFNERAPIANATVSIEGNFSSAEVASLDLSCELFWLE